MRRPPPPDHRRPGRLAPDVWAGAQTQLAAWIPDCTPCELQARGTQLVDALDADGAEPDDRPQPLINQLHLRRHPDGTGGTSPRSHCGCCAATPTSPPRHERQGPPTGRGADEPHDPRRDPARGHRPRPRLRPLRATTILHRDPPPTSTLAAVACRPAGPRGLVGIHLPAPAGRPRAGDRRHRRDRGGCRPGRCPRPPATRCRVAGPSALAGTSRPRPAGPVRRGRRRRACGGGGMAGSGPVRRQHRVPGAAAGRVLGGQPAVLRLRRGDRLARCRAADPATPALGTACRARRQRDLGGVAPAAVRHHRHLPDHARDRLRRLLPEHGRRVARAGLAVPAQPREHPRGGALPRRVRHRHHHAHHDHAHPTVMGAAITVAALAVVPSLLRVPRGRRP